MTTKGGIYMDDETLRYLIRINKVNNGTTYKQMAEILGLKQTSIYNWLRGDFNLDEKKKAIIEEYFGIVYGNKK